MSDSIIKVGKSVIQHGKENDRIYLMKIHNNEALEISSLADKLVKKYKYTKIFAKVPESLKNSFLFEGYTIEAHIPKFYNGSEDVFFMSKYLSASRNCYHDKEKILDILETSFKKVKIQKAPGLKEGFRCKKPSLDDTAKMAQVYQKVFESYPFPIHDPDYIAKTMKENVQYFAVWQEDDIVALASSEMDLDSKNTEMTDFATLPEYQGNSFAIYLLSEMEKDAKKRGIKIAYTIARALSYGMNATFSKMRYTFTGTLINNTNICGNLESMNVWYKLL